MQADRQPPARAAKGARARQRRTGCSQIALGGQPQLTAIIEHRTGTVGDFLMPVEGDFAIVSRVDLYTEIAQSVELRRGKSAALPVLSTREANGDGACVVASLSSGLAFETAPRLDPAIEGDEEVVAHILKPPLEMPIAQHGNIVVVPVVAGSG